MLLLQDIQQDYVGGIQVLSKHGLNAARLREKSESSKIAPFVNEIVGLTVPHLDDAVEYTMLIPRHLRGVRMFLVVPVYLAIETLALIKSNPVQAMAGPPVKLSRKDVTRLVDGAFSRVGSNKRIMKYYLSLRNKI